jgi:hypothetical protein
MADDEHCPNCRQLLPSQAADAAPATRCPRCGFPLLADASSTRAGIRPGLSSRPQTDRITAEVPAAVPGEPFVCPECRRPVEEEWLFCPHCEAILLDPSCNRRIILPRTLVPLLAAAGAFLVAGGLVMIVLWAMLVRQWVLAAAAGFPVYILSLLACPRVSQRFGLPRDVAESVTAVGLCMAIALTLFVLLWLVIVFTMLP